MTVGGYFAAPERGGYAGILAGWLGIEMVRSNEYMSVFNRIGDIKPIARAASLGHSDPGERRTGLHFTPRNPWDLRWFVGIPPVEDSLSDQVVAPIDPAVLPVPQAVLLGLMEAERVLVIGHVPPDVDTTGSVLSLGRLLRARGQEADICVDSALPGICRSFVRPGEVVRYSEVRGREYDLVVMVDAAQSDRFGEAQEAIQAASRVMIIDHHRVDASNESLGLKSTARLIKWIEPEVDAAALMVARLVTRLTPKGVDRTMLQIPLCGGILTDTDRFRHRGTHWSSLAQLKFLLEQVQGGLSTLDEHFTYRLPQPVQALLAPSPRQAPDVPQRFVAKVKEALAAGHVVEESALGCSATMIGLPKEMAALALTVAQDMDPSTTIDDIKGSLFDRLNSLIPTNPLAVLLMEDGMGTQVGIRSQTDGPACDLARELGGGGKGRMAGAYLKLPLVVVREMIARWVQRNEVVEIV